MIAINQHQSIDHRLLTTHQLIIESTLSLLVNPDAQGQGHHFYLEDLLNDTSIGLGYVTHSRVEQLLRRSELPVHQALWHRLSSASAMPSNRTVADRELASGFQKDIAFASLKTGVQHVADNSRFILITESSDALFSTLSPPGCRLTVHDQFFPVAQYHFVVATETSTPRNTGGGGGDRQFSRSRTSSPHWLIRQLDSALSQLHDNGVIQQLHNKWWTASNGNWGCSEPSTSGRSSAMVGRSPPSSPIGRQPPRSDDDWRARERIFFESPLRRSTASTMTTTPPPTSTAADVTSTNVFDRDSFTSVSQDDVTYPVTRPEVNRVLDMFRDYNETTDSSIAMTERVLLNKSELERLLESDPTTALTTSQAEVITSENIFEAHQHAMVTKKPKKTTTTKPPRPQRQRHNHQTSARRLLPTPTVTNRSVSYIIDHSLATLPLFGNEDVFDDRHIAADDVIVEDADTDAQYHDDATEQEMAVKDHWMRRQASAGNDVRSSSAMDATSADDDVPEDSANRAEAATANAACTCHCRLALVGALVANVVLFRFR